MKNRIYSIIDDQNKLAHVIKHGTKSQKVGETLYTLAAFDGIVYCPDGLLKTVSRLTETGKTVTADTFVDMIDQGIMSKIDDKMLQMNDNYRGRNAKTREISFGRKIDDMVEAVERARIDSWQARGKHTRGKPMKTNRDMLKDIMKILERVDQTTSNFELMLDRALEKAGVTPPQKEIIRRHLSLVPNE